MSMNEAVSTNRLNDIGLFAIEFIVHLFEFQLDFQVQTLNCKLEPIPMFHIS